MGFLDSIFNPGSGYDQGQKELEKYYQQGQGYLQPYNQYGQSAYGDYSGAMKRLLDPAALQAEWTKGYSESPEAKQAEAMARTQGLDAISGLGLMGSNTALNALQSGTTQIGLQDRQNYLNDLMQKYMAGTGIAGNIFNTGAGAAGQMSQNAMNMGGNAAQMAYGKQNASNSLLGGLMGLGGSLGMAYLTGGMSGLGGMGGLAGLMGGGGTASAPAYAGGGRVPMSNFGWRYS